MNDDRQPGFREVADAPPLPPPPPVRTLWLMAAFFCERILREQSDAFSAIRIIEEVDLEYTIPLPLTREQIAPFLSSVPPIHQQDIFLVLLIRGTPNEEAHGFMVVTHHEGYREVLGAGQFTLVSMDVEEANDPGWRGANLTIRIPLTTATPSGVTWYEIYLDDVYATSVPLEIDSTVSVLTSPPVVDIEDLATPLLPDQANEVQPREAVDPPASP